MPRLILFLSAVTLLQLAACSSTRDIGSHDRPLAATATEQQQDVELLASLDAQNQAANVPVIKPARRYSLPELIDIAQQRNPATRQAWLHLRKAGRQAKIVESALLPFIAATVIGGAQQFQNTVELPLVGPLEVDGSSEGVAGVITANWLLFDFGENAALRRVANNLAKISGLTFNHLHQQLIFDVSQSYHTRLAALEKQKYAQHATEQATLLADAAKRRLDGGVGTKVELAQARQLLAQTKLTQRIANGEANTSAVSLASALSLTPTTRILLKPHAKRLPRAADRSMERVIKNAFTARPDVLASLAQVRAAQNNLDAVAASYLPKVMLGANLADGNAALDLIGFSANNIGPTRGSGALIAVSMPLFDGNLRHHRMQNMRDQLAAARSGVDLSKAVASREIAVAYEGLRTALAVNHAAQELVKTAKTTADAAQEAYQNGVGTIIDASLATLGLYTAKETLVDSRRAAHHAATALALAVGQ